MPLLYPAATWRPVDSHGGLMAEQRGLVEHITTDNGDPWDYFSNPANQASSHLFIALDGTVEQYIDLRVASWAQSGGNYAWTSCEIAGVTGTAKTPAQTEALARLFAWGHTVPELAWPLQLADTPNGTGLGWHGMGGAAWGGHTACPGDARLGQRDAVLARAKTLTTGDVMLDPEVKTRFDNLDKLLGAIAFELVPPGGAQSQGEDTLLLRESVVRARALQTATDPHAAAAAIVALLPVALAQQNADAVLSALAAKLAVK